MPEACIQAAQAQGYNRQIDYHRLDAENIGRYIARAASQESS
jgi:hypothetical protein